MRWISLLSDCMGCAIPKTLTTETLLDEAKRMKKILLAAAVAIVTVVSSQSVTANEAIEVMRKFYEVADTRPFNFAELSEFYSKDYVDHHRNPATPADTPSGVVFQMLADGAPDSSHNIRQMLPSGNNIVTIVWSYEGTNTNNLFGIPSQDPALPFAIAGVEVWKVKNGKITDLWHVEDIAGLMSQLGKQ